MNKQQLLDEISKLPDDIKFLVSKDAEGNDFAKLDEISIEYTLKEDLELGYVDYIQSEEDLLEDGKIPDEFQKVAVFWPF